MNRTKTEQGTASENLPKVGRAPMAAANEMARLQMIRASDVLDASAIIQSHTGEALRLAAELVRTARKYFPKSMHNSDKFQLEQACAAIARATERQS